MAGVCFWLALMSPLSLALGWFVLGYPPLWTAGNAPALALMASSPLAFLASSIIGIRQVLVGDRDQGDTLPVALREPASTLVQRDLLIEAAASGYQDPPLPQRG